MLWMRPDATQKGVFTLTELNLKCCRLEDAYRDENFELIERIKEYVFRLARAKEGHDASSDLGTIVAVSFFEHLPQSKLIRQDIGRWFSAREIENMKEILTYHGTEEQYEEMLSSAKSFTTKKSIKAVVSTPLRAPRSTA